MYWKNGTANMVIGCKPSDLAMTSKKLINFKGNTSMARFTVEDCMENISNRFDMTLAAALRARKIEKGSEVFLDNQENDKPTVLALREIAEQKVDGSILATVD